jgi:hypothetical protein
MRHQFSRNPAPLSILERQTQQRLGIPEGAFCCVQMVKGKAVIKGGVRVGTYRKISIPIGQCPRYATINKNGAFFCDAHGQGSMRD